MVMWRFSRKNFGFTFAWIAVVILNILCDIESWLFPGKRNTGSGLDVTEFVYEVLVRLVEVMV